VNAPAYYEDLKNLAREVRAQNGLDTPRVLRRDLRKIYSKCGISIDLWPYRLRNLRGAFFSDDLGMTVMLAKGLPEDPMVFTMAHELKHYYRDRELGLSYCDLSNEQKHLKSGLKSSLLSFCFPKGTSSNTCSKWVLHAGCALRRRLCV
jgi:hypothetical protein